MQRDDDLNFWQSVTGTIEEKERAIDTAYREVKEETGIDLLALGCKLVDCHLTNRYLIRKSWLYRYPPGTLYNQEHVFAVRVPSDLPILLTEHVSYGWEEKQVAAAKVWSETNKIAILQQVPG